MTAELDHADIRWRVSNTWDKGDTKWGMLVGYIDARTAMDALDTLDPAWSAVHGTPIIVGSELIGVPCAITVNGVTRSDVGMPSSQEPIKGAYSDALKRAAVHFGIGRELYELPKIAVECTVVNGKVRGPKALPTYRKGRWEIDRAVGWVKYEREPEEPAKPAPAQRTPEEQALLDELLAIPGMSTARLSLMADAVGVPKGQRATAEQLRAMLAALESPGSGVPTASPASTPPAEDSAAATDGSGDAIPPSSESPAPEALLESAVELTGGELVDVEPPKPGTPEYRALPTGVERAKAKAYHEAHPEPEEPTLAEQLRVEATA